MGAYGRCRHPPYQSLLLSSLGLLLALVTVLSLKARREEQRRCP
ncbi:MAG: hypothetical protein ACNA8O_01850 [Cyanobacteriota bacterium]